MNFVILHFLGDNVSKLCYPGLLEQDLNAFAINRKNISIILTLQDCFILDIVGTYLVQRNDRARSGKASAATNVATKTRTILHNAQCLEMPEKLYNVYKHSEKDLVLVKIEEKLFSPYMSFDIQTHCQRCLSYEVICQLRYFAMEEVKTC